MKSERILQRFSKQSERTSQQGVRNTTKAQSQILKEQQRALDKQVREERKAATEIQRTKERAAKAFAREQARLSKETARKRLQYERETSRKISSVGRSARGAFRGAVGMTAGALGLIGGFSAQQGLSERISADTMAAGLANRTLAAGTGGDKDFGKLKDEITGRARSLQEQYGLSSQDSVIGLESKFNERTGEYGAGADLTKGLVQMAAAVGMTEDEFGMLGKAAGDVFTNLKKSGKTTEEATKATKEAMLASVGQSAVGSISVGDLAKNAPKLLAVAGQLGGDAGTNVGRTVALANAIAPNVGSAEETATSIEGIARDFSVNFKKFKKLGVNTRDEKGNTKDLQTLIVDSAIKSGGSQDKMTSLFGDVSRKGVGGFFKTVREMTAAGKSEAEIRTTLLGNFEALNQATLTEAQAKALAANMNESAGKKITRALTRLKNTFGEKLEPVVMRLIPHLEELAPLMGDLLGKFGDFIGWFASNPMSGLGALIAGKVSADITGAAIGSVINKTFTGVITGSGLGESLNKAIAANIGGLSVGAMTLGVGVAYIVADKLFDDATEADKGIMKATSDAKRAIASGSTGDKRLALADLDQAQAKADDRGFLSKIIAGDTSEDIQGAKDETRKQLIAAIEKDKESRDKNTAAQNSQKTSTENLTTAINSLLLGNLGNAPFGPSSPNPPTSGTR